VATPTALSAPQLRHQVAALQQAANAAKSVQQKASDEIKLQQFQAQLKHVQADATESSETAPEDETPTAASTASTGHLVDTQA
jgi:hypothetical protein